MTSQAFLTFDIEEWYHANYPGLVISEETKNRPTNVVSLVEQLLHICDLLQVRATFFVVGELAQKKPQIVHRIVSAGHELAAHSFHHERVDAMGAEKFLEDCQRTKQVLQDIGGVEVLGYRAPSWSVTEETLGWYAAGLSKAGYRYSSSIFPAKTFLYGIKDAPRKPHFIKNSSILEIPCSVASVGGKQLGYSGGAYLRLLPEWVIRFFLNRARELEEPAILYLHPREIDPNQPKLKLPLFTHFLHYVGISETEAKLVSLLSTLRPELQQTLGEASLEWRR